jgi:hypothetical protein
VGRGAFRDDAVTDRMNLSPSIRRAPTPTRWYKAPACVWEGINAQISAGLGAGSSATDKNETGTGEHSPDAEAMVEKKEA